jgi:hypothetical protein|tara:strand:- start:180 stop:404 length:225 start_codon:yes stop_codon:yes gene_type:complete
MRFGPQNIFGVSKLKLIQNTVKTDRVKEGYFHNVSVVAVDAEGNEQEIATFYNDGYGEKSRILLSTDYTGVVDG